LIKINYSYEKVPTLRKFALCDKRIKAVQGPFGSGKSSGMVFEIARRGQEQEKGRDGIRRTRWAVVRNTYSQLKDTTIKTVLDWFPPRYFGQYKIADHDYLITGFPGCEIELNFRALDRPEDIGKLLSAEYTGAWLNEYREIPKAIFDALDGRIDRYPSMRDGGATYPCILMDTNPPEEDGEWFNYFEKELPDNAVLFKQPSGLSREAENILQPAEWEAWKAAFDRGEVDFIPGLKPDYYTNLAKGKGEDFINVYIKGNYGYVKEGKPVYEASFSDLMHVAKEYLRPIEGRELIVSFDFGLTPACILNQITPMGYFNTIREILSDGMGIQQFVRNKVKPLLSTEFRDFAITGTGDPAGTQRSQTDEKTCFQILKEEGFKVYPARSNDLTSRIGAVEGFLARLIQGRPAYQLDPRCTVLRKGFNSGYYYKQIKGQDTRYAPEPSKNKYSHPHDALQYGAMHVTQVIKKAGKTKSGRTEKYHPASIGGY
jgi:hypothetical protein